MKSNWSKLADLSRRKLVLVHSTFFHWALPIILLVWIATPLSLVAEVGQESLPVTLPFAIGERLTYDLSWTYVKAGTAVMAGVYVSGALSTTIVNVHVALCPPAVTWTPIGYVPA